MQYILTVVVRGDPMMRAVDHLAGKKSTSIQEYNFAISSTQGLLSPP